MGCLHSKWYIGHEPNSPRQGPKEKRGMMSTRIESAHPSASSDGEDCGDGDRLHELGTHRDSDVGIIRLSRVSSQFLPPEGSKTVGVPLGNYELRYSFLSQRGFYPDALDKPNQDSFCIHTPFGTNPNDHFFGVFDGHGEYGSQCSQFVKQRLCENLLRKSRLQVDVIEAMHASFLTTNSQLHADVLDDSMSGTTAVTILVRGRTIYVANAGDSRAVIAERRGKDIVAMDLSSDQTPFRSDELERVKHCGARVLTLDQIEGLKNPDVKCWGMEEEDDGDPPRLWVQNGMYPGAAFTRSIGDSIAESIGVVASPEIYALELTHNHPFFVIASDGVFEFLSSQTVVEMVSNFKDPRDACAAIVAESYRLWLQYEMRTDDITIIVVHINGLNETKDVQHALDAPSKPLAQVMEETGSESPFPVTWDSKNHRVRNELSQTRLKAIESSLENGHSWFPPVSHRRTWEEEAHIERLIRDHFLFRRLTESQFHVLLDCMQRVEVKPGDVVVEQGREGECFYVVTNGEFEVLATQEEEMEVVSKVLHQYTAEKLSSFGELALMYNKPLQSSVRAVTAGTLWALKTEDFREILTSEFSNIVSLKLLRSIEPFSRLTILQLSCVAESLFEVSFSDGQKIIEKDVPISGLYIIKKGLVRLSYIADISSPPLAFGLFSTKWDKRTAIQDNNEHVVELAEGSHFGEWTLFGESVSSLSVSSIGDVVCLVITKEKFDSVVGSVPKLSQQDGKMKYSLDSSKETILSNDVSTCKRINASDLEWKMSIYATDCCEVGLALLKGTDTVRTLKRFSKRKIKDLGKEEQVMKEKKILTSFNASASMPPVLCTWADRSHVGILLDCCLACTLSSVLTTPLDENSARFCAASLVVSLEELHKNSVLHRGISPDVLMLDQTGRLQLVDFRFAKMLGGERTFTICGISDSLAPEIIQGKGHGFAADWWALGVVIYFLLQAETPFGSWRGSELETFSKISKGHFTLPQTFSIEAVDLITKLLDVDEATRLGSHGPDSVKAHSWFNGVDWKTVADGTFPVPQEITSRINAYLENHVEEVKEPISSPSHEPELNSPEWLEDW